MNGTYYKNPTFPAATDNNYQENNNIVEENKYNIETINEILKNNIGKKCNINSTYNNETKTHSGIIEKQTNNLLLLSNPETGYWYLLPIKKINYIEFEEKIII